MANIFHIDRPTNKIILGTTGTTINVASHTASKLLALDASKNLSTTIEPSTDGTLGDNSDLAIPTEKAVKTYVDGLGAGYQPLDAGLTSLAGLTYTSDSFIKVTAEDTYAIRTIAEVKTDLSLNLVENTAISTWAGSENITTVGALVSGSIAAGFTEIATTYTAAKCTDATADNTAENETSHADVVVDGDFTSNGLLNRTGAGAYSILALGTDVQAYHANLAAIAGGTWTGAASITTLGTIGTGTWQGTQISADYIADRAIKPYHISRHYLVSDHFMGLSLNAYLWTKAVTGTGYGNMVSGGHQGNYRLGSGGDAGSTAMIWIEYAIIGAGNQVTLEASANLTNQTFVETYFLELYYDANHYIRFYYDASLSINIHGAAKNGVGNETVLDLEQSISPFTTFKIIKMVVDMTVGTVKFYYQGSLLGTINTNVPSQDMIIRGRIQDESYASDRIMNYDYFRVWLDSAETY